MLKFIMLQIEIILSKVVIIEIAQVFKIAWF